MPGPSDRSSDVASAAFLPFLLLAFGIAWGNIAAFALWNDAFTSPFGELSASHPLFILAVYAPAIAAFAVVLATAGPRGLGRYPTRLGLWRAPVVWYVFLIVGIPALYIAATATRGTLGGWWPPFTTVGAALQAMAFMLVLGPIEAFGWRGFALPILQRHPAPPLGRAPARADLGRLAPAGLLPLRDAAELMELHALPHRLDLHRRYPDAAVQCDPRQHPAGGALSLPAQQPALAGCPAQRHVVLLRRRCGGGLAEPGDDAAKVGRRGHDRHPACRRTARLTRGFSRYLACREAWPILLRKSVDQPGKRRRP